tara:strand:+ start:387 stop:623 length:237 start_codon:yes stop_codon:yes gene_type:complete
MKKNDKKEKLLLQLCKENWKVFYEVHNGVAHGDLVGNDDVYYHKAMKYVPNHILKRWIKSCKKEVREATQNEHIGWNF